MREKYLLGIIDNQIILGEIEVRDWNGYDEFSASFDVGEAFNIDIDEETIRDYFIELWNCYDNDTKIELLYDGDRTFQDWLVEETCDVDYYSIKDCSCTDFEMSYKDITINFETICCGQHDCRSNYNFDKMKFTSKEAFDKLMNLWDNYHIKEIDDNAKREIDEVKQLLESYNWNNYNNYNNIEKFIKENLEY